MPPALPDLQAYDDAQLIEIYGTVMVALLERQIVRSANNLIADIAERIVARYVDGELAPPNEKSFDVTRSNRSNLSAFRSMEFDELAVVIFENDLTLTEAAFVPRSVVVEFARWSETWKAHRVAVSARLLADQRVTRVAADKLRRGHR